LERIRNNSELAELWEEAGELDEWKDVLEDLTNRLNS
jgi:hypothetical protein